MELAAAGEDMKKLREIARTHIEKAAAGDMQAIKELANRLDGRPAQILEHGGPDSNPIEKIVHEIVHLTPMSADEISAAEVLERRTRSTRAKGSPALCFVRVLPDALALLPAHASFQVLHMRLSIPQIRRIKALSELLIDRLQ